jgi:hypothetical protein
MEQAFSLFSARTSSTVAAISFPTYERLVAITDGDPLTNGK